MSTIIWTAVIVTIVNRLLPFPPLDDRIRAAYSWLRDKVMAWLQ